MTLKRSAMKPSSIPMKRTAIRAGKAPTNRAGEETLRARNPDIPRKWAFKSRGPKMTPIRRAARNEECTLSFPDVCNRDKTTSVWCHSNRYEHGKGMGIKADDEHGCIGCSACHAFYDGGYALPNTGWTRAAVEARFDLAEAYSRAILRAKGVPMPGSDEAQAANGHIIQTE